MKKALVVTLCVTWEVAALAQPAVDESATGPTEAGSGSPTNFTVVEKGADYRIWQRVVSKPSALGPVPVVREYTELGTGMHYQRDGNGNGDWLETSEQIELLPGGGAAARNGPHQLYLPGDIYDGVIELITPDQVHLKARPIGVAYFNGDDSAMIGTLTNSIGQLLPSGNQVIYTNAFSGISADLLITYRKSGIECDLVFRARPPSPEICRMDSNDVRTRIELWTEFFDTAEPKRVATWASPEDSLEDSTLQFGENTMMIPGRTFGTGHEGTYGASVYKSWLQNVQGRTVLIEELPFCRLRAQFDQVAALEKKSDRAYASIPSERGPFPFAQLPGSRRIDGSKKDQMLVAKADLAAKPGVCLDYTTISGSRTGYVFTSDMTYYVSSTLSLSGTNVWEPGTVLKLASNVSVTIVSGPLTPQLVFNTSSYKPVVFTCKDDATVGESTGTGTPVGYYANPALNLQNAGNQSFSNVRFLYAQQAVSLSGGNLTNYDCQFVNCQNGYTLSSASLRLGNCLFGNVKTNFNSSAGVTVVAQSATFSGSTNLISTSSSSAAFHLTNCVLSAITSLTNAAATLDGSFNGFYNAPQFGSSQFTSSSYPFQTVGAGSYYLAADSPFRSVGTTNIDSSLLADIARQTTYPPIVYSNVTLSGAMTFFPQAERNSGVPDLGAHYNPVDYFFGGVKASTNIAFTGGTAAGWFELPGNGGPGYGILLSNAQTATFAGTATNPCVFIRYSNVQEGGNGLWKDKGWLAGIIAGQQSFDPSNPGSIVASFLHSTLLASGPGHWRDYNSMLAVEATHCEFLGGNLGGYNTMSYYTNCLMDRINLTQQTSNPQPKVILRNSTWHGGHLQFIHTETGYPHWFTSIRDSAFDSTTISTGDPSGGDPTVVDYDYNSFLVNSNRTSPTGPHDVIVTNGYNWQVAWFGNYYLPASSPLIDAGDTNANYVGLYHFTTQTNANAIEGDSMVDLGYHYVGVDGNGNPLDSNGDGIPDYLSDANGNGIVDSGEIEWNTGPDTGLKVRIARPNRNSPLP